MWGGGAFTRGTRAAEMLHVSDEGRPSGERGVTMPNLLPLALLPPSPFGTLPCPPVRVVGGWWGVVVVWWGTREG